MHRYNVLIGVPSSGVICEGTAQATYQASLHHDFDRVPSNWSGPNFNKCWKEALNRGLNGEYTHHAQVHSDIKVYEDHLFDADGVKIEFDLNSQPTREVCREKSKLWLDVLLDDMEAKGVPFLSVPIALKDSRGMCSCGAGDPEDPWTIWRRFTVRELEKMPNVFEASEVGYGDKYLLHSFALCLWDLRHPCWHQRDARGRTLAFNFSEEIVWNTQKGEYELFCQSEDWAYSRLMWRRGIRSALSRNVKVHHLMGNIEYPNYGDWGTFTDGDEDLAFKWRKAVVKTREGVVLEGV